MTRILVTGGGTAGHVFPALAVLQVLRRKLKTEILFVGSRDGPEVELVAGKDIPFRGIAAGKLRRYPDVRNLVDPFKVGAGFVESLGVLASFRPDIVFAKGGYVTVPVVLAAKSRRIPIITHESDLIMGLSNRLSNRLAAKICTAFPIESYPALIRTKLVFTGNPLREEFAQVKKRKFHARFGLSPLLPTILVIGGSQGAIGLNDLTLRLTADLTKRGQILHLTGRLDFARLAEYRSKLPPAQAGRYVLYPFIEEIWEAMATADIVVSRAGANVLFELAFLAKPTILVPLPSAANDHQRKNALYFQKRGAVLVAEQDETQSKKLYGMIIRLLREDIEREKLSHRIEELAVPDAAERVANVILQVSR
jgi:UDP-N-acetylglucosamine--N-acetylmuramyl-(pentapeptide) pyrophosphoryl-undecaprenol N-acetylglucosamine transferase